jgi:phytoene dehydrogenase-like protein
MADRYDALVLGAGMSGLAAGIRLAQAGRRVAVLERHYLWGGLNSFYKLAGRRFDVGLHALTNYVPPRTPGAPLSRVLRQLRLRHADLRLGEQRVSRILFPERRLEFTNELERLEESVADAFPGRADAFRALVAAVRAYDVDAAEPDERSARAVLAATLGEPLLAEMLLLPCLFYGAPREDDVDWASYCVLFQSIFLEGLARPEGGIKPMLDLLVARLKDVGGELWMRTGVRAIRTLDGRATGVELDDGTILDADLVLSSAGWPETMRLAGRDVPPGDVGRLSFLEAVSIVDAPPAELGFDAATAFYCAEERAVYRVPDGDLVEPRSGVLCSPNNYAASEPLPEGVMRITVTASHAAWTALDDEAYAAAKARSADRAIAATARWIPDWRPRTTFRDVFTPRTIERFTSRGNGAVYGARIKRRDGTTPVAGLFLCGTDQGFLGVIGALVSGIAMANRHGLAPATAASRARP